MVDFRKTATKAIADEMRARAAVSREGADAVMSIADDLMRDRVPVDDGVALRELRRPIDMRAELRRRRREATFLAVVLCAAVLGVVVLGACVWVAVYWI
jgi:hypothetical protein